MINRHPLNRGSKPNHENLAGLCIGVYHPSDKNCLNNMRHVLRETLLLVCVLHREKKAGRGCVEGGRTQIWVV